MRKASRVTLALGLVLGLTTAVQADTWAPLPQESTDTEYLVHAGEAMPSNIEIAVRASERLIPPVDRVLIARDDVFADSLASSVLQFDSHLLLVPSNGPVPERVLTEIERLRATRATILGGTSAVSASVATQLQGEGLVVDRLSGSSRIETAIAIARTQSGPLQAVLARAFPSAGREQSQAFVDALSGGSIAAIRRAPVLLTQTAALSPETRAYLEQTPSITSIKIMGGTSAIAAAVQTELEQMGYDVQRLSGPSREETALEAARHLGRTDAGKAPLTILVDGWSADAWAAGFTMARAVRKAQGAIVLSNGDGVPPATAAWLRGADPQNVTNYPLLLCATTAKACDVARANMSLPVPPASDGSCRTRNTFSDNTLLTTSDHYAVHYGGETSDLAALRAGAGRMLGHMEAHWDTAVDDFGLAPPSPTPAYCVPVYLSKTGGTFENTGHGIGTDDQLQKYLIFEENVALGIPSWPSANDAAHVGLVAHETFHLFQSRARLEREGENIWWVESGANWFARHQFPGNVEDGLSAGGYLMLPHLPLWAAVETQGPGDTTSAVVTAHAYGAYLAIEAVEDAGVPARDIAAGWVQSVHSGAHHLAEAAAARGLDLGTILGDFAAHMATLDRPDGAFLAAGRRQMVELHGSSDEHSTTVDLGSIATNGLTRPPTELRPAAWGYNTIRFEAPATDDYEVRFVGDATGEFGTPAEFRATAVRRVGNTRTYLPIGTGGTGDGSITIRVSEGDELWLAVAATPDLFTSNEQFGYRFAIEPA